MKAFDWLNMLIPILIKAAKSAIDGFLGGEELTSEGKRAIYDAWVLSHHWVKEVVEDTETPYDDKALQMFWDLCVDTAEEAGFELPDVPSL